jgi:hypothetical protein
MLAPEVLLGHRIDQDRQQHEGKGLFQRLGADQRHHPGTAEAAHQGTGHAPGHRRARERHAARELHGRPRGAPDGAALVGTEERRGDGRRVGREQRGYEHQSASPHHRVDETGQAGRHRHYHEIDHGGIIDGRRQWAAAVPQMIELSPRKDKRAQPVGRALRLFCSGSRCKRHLPGSISVRTGVFVSSYPLLRQAHLMSAYDKKVYALYRRVQ